MVELEEEIRFYDAVYQRSEVHIHQRKRAKNYAPVDQRSEDIVNDLITFAKRDVSATLKKLNGNCQTIFCRLFDLNARKENILSVGP